MNRVTLLVLAMSLAGQAATAEPTGYTLENRGSVFGYLVDTHQVGASVIAEPDDEGSDPYRGLQKHYSSLPGLSAIKTKTADRSGGTASAVFQGRVHLEAGEVRGFLSLTDFPWESTNSIRILDETNGKYVFSGNASDLSSLELKEGHSYLLSTGVHFGLKYRDIPTTVDPIDYLPDDIPVTPAPGAVLLAGIGLSTGFVWRRWLRPARKPT